MSVVTEYIAEREKYFNSIGKYFCENEVKCDKQCEVCNKYFENNLIKERLKEKK